MAGLESPVEESPWGVVEEEATIDSRRERRLRARGGEGMWGHYLNLPQLAQSWRSGGCKKFREKFWKIIMRGFLWMTAILP